MERGAEMTGLPAIPTQRKPRDLMLIMLIDPVEKLTEALQRGHAFDDASLNEMIILQRRLSAFGFALQARLDAANIGKGEGE